MTKEEFFEIMDDNSSEFPEFAAMSQEEKEQVANTNIITGPAEAFYDDDGRLAGVGGMRIVGVAEAWSITRKDIRESQKKRLLRKHLEVMKRFCDEHGLWRVFAVGNLSTNFLKHLGFEKTENTLMWSRKE